MKIIIAGGRDFNDYNKLKIVCDHTFRKLTAVEIVSGTARGADKLGEKYAKEKGYKIKRFAADWNKHGRSAGYIRNAEMAKYASVLIAFWNGDTKHSGTYHMINLAKKGGLKVKIVK